MAKFKVYLVSSDNLKPLFEINNFVEAKKKAKQEAIERVDEVMLCYINKNKEERPLFRFDPLGREENISG